MVTGTSELRITSRFLKATNRRNNFQRCLVTLQKPRQRGFVLEDSSRMGHHSGAASHRVCLLKYVALYPYSTVLLSLLLNRICGSTLAPSARLGSTRVQSITWSSFCRVETRGTGNWLPEGKCINSLFDRGSTGKGWFLLFIPVTIFLHTLPIRRKKRKC